MFLFLYVSVIMFILYYIYMPHMNSLQYLVGKVSHPLVLLF